MKIISLAFGNIVLVILYVEKLQKYFISFFMLLKNHLSI